MKSVADVVEVDVRKKKCLGKWSPKINVGHLEKVILCSVSSGEAAGQRARHIQQFCSHYPQHSSRHVKQGTQPSQPSRLHHPAIWPITHAEVADRTDEALRHTGNVIQMSSGSSVSPYVCDRNSFKVQEEQSRASEAHSMHCLLSGALFSRKINSLAFPLYNSTIYMQGGISVNFHLTLFKRKGSRLHAVGEGGQNQEGQHKSQSHAFINNSTEMWAHDTKVKETDTGHVKTLGGRKYKNHVLFSVLVFTGMIWLQCHVGRNDRRH